MKPAVIAATLFGMALPVLAFAELTRVQVGLLSLEAPEGSERALESLAERARVILPQLERDLNARPRAPYRMLLVPAAAASDSEIVSLDRAAPPWAAGFLIPERRIGAIRVSMAARYPYGTLESVLAHEATHMLLHDAAGRSLPRWFDEGVATWEGRRWSLEDILIHTRALLTADLPSLAELDTAFWASTGEVQWAYAASFAFVSWNVRRHGASLIPAVIREARSLPFPAAWEAATGVPLEDSEASWRRESLFKYRWLPVLTASSTLWIGITFLAVVAGARRRARARAVRERWAEEERLETPEGGEAPPAEAASNLRDDRASEP